MTIKHVALVTFIVAQLLRSSFADTKTTSEQLLQSHTEHVANIQQLGKTLLAISDQFSEVNPKILHSYLALHEASKKEFLTETPDLLDNAFYRDVTDLPATEHNMTMDFYALLERKDKKVATTFFRQAGILGPNEALEDNPVVLKYLRVEKIANVVERGNSANAKAEFGRVVIPAHTYFDTVAQDRDAAKVALRLQHEFYTASNLPSDVTRFVQSYDEYRLYNFTHILRVTRLGLALLQKYQTERFEDVDSKILEEFLLLHDQSKLNFSENFLARHQLQAQESVASQLYNNYGVDFSTIPDDWKKESGDLVKQLNRVDEEVATSFFRRKGLLGKDESMADNTLVQKYLQLEKIADLVDRGGSPATTEEFGRAMLPAHTFFVKVLKDFESAAYAAVLEHNYSEIVAGDAHMDYIPEFRLALKRHKWNSSKRKFSRTTGECMQYMVSFILDNNTPSLSMK